MASDLFQKDDSIKKNKKNGETVLLKEIKDALFKCYL